MSRETILVVEDEDDIAELIRYNLEKQHYVVTTVASGEKGLEAARRKPPDLVLLDLMLPGMDGLEVCRSLKSDPLTKDIPIVMVTARGEESDIVAGLELGAEDYVTKPFGIKILLARVRAVLRRRTIAVPAESETLHVHEIEIHPGRHEVRAGGDEVVLTNTEFRILHFLARRPGWVFTRYQIVDGIRGENYPVTERAVDVQIVALRRKLGGFGGLIETVRGVGYRFKE
ncbi:MAG TPA: response regulator transcription factor [Candidatus Limnocylindrales bacterium]|nr:response regulator transcription factor [Candidatus Limnocylindrales bacterium]